jgi:mRNA interferase MazF
MRSILKWQVWRADLEPVIGSEQGKSRPVLVISEDHINKLLNCVNIIPFTSKKEGRIIYPNEVSMIADDTGLINDSILLCHQIRTLDKSRLSHYYGTISSNELKRKTFAAISFQLGMK